MVTYDNSTKATQPQTKDAIINVDVTSNNSNAREFNNLNKTNNLNNILVLTDNLNKEYKSQDGLTNLIEQ